MKTASNIRNFCIIAHIDHGKSTLADRFLEITGTVEKRKMKEQILDTMDIERERGITIKLQPARMDYTPKFQISNFKFQIEDSVDIRNSDIEIIDSKTPNTQYPILNTDSKPYILNLIDTPGHVDFSYEVSRSLAAVDGAILIVDASQGIEAQTLSTLTMAVDHGLIIIPVVNKIDLPHAEPEKVSREIIDLLGVREEDIILASGKTGEGVEKILDRIVSDVPPPSGKPDQKTRALIFDSFFDPYKGVVCYVRVFDGNIKQGQKIKMMVANTIGEALEVGYLKPNLVPKPELNSGEIGYIITGVKDVSEARVGDTITLLQDPAQDALPGYRKVVPFVFAGVFTTQGDDYQFLREALSKLQLSDSSLVYEPESSQSLGFGFRCGFLGLLHLEIVKERLEREFDLDLIVTTPSVSYEITTTSGVTTRINKPSEIPDRSYIDHIKEPWTKLELVSPSRYIGAIMEMTQKKRGIYKNLTYIEEDRAIITFEIPLASIITDYYDSLKSMSSGYASMNYEMIGFRESDLVKIDILIMEKPVDSLSLITHRSEAQTKSQETVSKLKGLIPKQNFKIVIQAAIGGKIIAREDISAFRKDVIAKLYGGDVTRKRKLLEKQKKGKEKMKMIGSVAIPSDVFIQLLKK